MGEQINFETKDMAYLGRNGYGKMYGMNTYPVKGCSDVPYVWMEPINSKGNVARCYMQIPINAIPELVDKLMKYYNDMQESNK